MTTNRFAPVITLSVTVILSTTLYWYCTAQEPARVTLVSRKAPSVKASDAPRAPVALGHSSFMSPHASPIVTQGNRVFVANTPADTVDVIDTNDFLKITSTGWPANVVYLRINKAPGRHRILQ